MMLSTTVIIGESDGTSRHRAFHLNNTRSCLLVGV